MTSVRPVELAAGTSPEAERSRTELRHVYLEGAKGLRDDLPG